jgi:hypothetical protein
MSLPNEHIDYLVWSPFNNPIRCNVDIQVTGTKSSKGFKCVPERNIWLPNLILWLKKYNYQEVVVMI